MNEIEKDIEILKHYESQEYFFSKDLPALHAFRRAIEALEFQDKTESTLRNNNYDSVNDLLWTASKLIERQRWIPVIERLPENKKVVIITRSTGRVGLGFCNRNSNNQWRDGEGYLLTCPLAWRELPEPYKEVLD